jgi:transcriptional regulator with XRE-family HTH domain
MIHLGERIKELRARDGRTQEALASRLGVTAQAISRWEKGICYPDMELIPSIANCFGVSIDELFGYENSREHKIDAILARVDAFGIKERADDAWIEDCLAILREGLIEFPGNERLLLALADTLTEAGWRRYREWMEYDEAGYLRHRYEMHRDNPFWTEAISVAESLTGTTKDGAVLTKAISILVLLYRNIGETEKAAICAQKMPPIKNCRELLLASAVDGRERTVHVGEFLLEAARLFCEQLVQGLMTNKRLFETDLPIKKLKGAIALFDLICEDGNFGVYHDSLIKLHLYLSRVQWARGYRDEAFDSLDKALFHAKALEQVLAAPEHRFTAPLVSGVATDLGKGRQVRIAAELPEDWPFWQYPDSADVAKEIKADPRWADWVRRAKA